MAVVLTSPRTESVSVAAPPPERRVRAGAALLGIGVLVAVVLHRLAGHGFPVPWVDEIDFLEAPAQLARHGTIAVPRLLGPHGMFWVPDLISFLIAPVYRILPTTIDVARGFVFVVLVGAAIGIWTAGRRAGASPVAAGAVVAVWLCTPRVVMLGNIARHEVFVVFFVAWALAALLDGRRVLGLSLAALAALTHPAGIPLALAVVATSWRTESKPTRRWERALAAAVVVLVLFEIVHFGTNAAEAVRQLTFQLHRKSGREALVSPWLLLVMSGGVIVGLRRLRGYAGGASVAFTSVAFAGYLVSVVGQEMWYDVYGFEFAIVLLAMGYLASNQRRGQRADIRRVAVAVGIAALVVPTLYASGFYGMRFGTRSAEWDDFVADVRTQLHAVADEQHVKKTVLISSLSGLPWPVESQTMGDLEFYKETEVTRADRPFDYLLYANTACCQGRNVVPQGHTVFEVRSSQGAFQVVLLEHPVVDGKPYWND